MAKTIEDLFYYIHLSGNCILLFLFIFFFKRTKKEIPLVLIAVYALLDSSLNIFTFQFSAKLYLYIWATFTLIEYSIFSYIIGSNIRKVSIRKTILYISIAFIVFTSFYNFATNFKNIDSIPIGIETILILLFSFYYLYEEMNDTSNLFVYSKYQFWIVIGFMIYLAGSFFVYIFASGLNNEILNQYWFFTNIFYFLMIILFSISLLVFNKKTRNTNPTNFRPYLN